MHVVCPTCAFTKYTQYNYDTTSLIILYMQQELMYLFKGICYSNTMIYSRYRMIAECLLMSTQILYPTIFPRRRRCYSRRLFMGSFSVSEAVRQLSIFFG